MKKLIVILCLLFLCGCGCSEENTCPVPINQPTATATVLPTATPEPTPEPTPSPRPLLPVELADYTLPESAFGQAQEQGWVSTLEYETKDYVSGSEQVIVKSMDVYKPYNYDENKQYNVLFLMHIAGWDETYWFRNSFEYPSPEGGYSGLYLYEMLDRMIEQGRCEPMIVISLDGFLYDEYRWVHKSSHSYDQFHHEFSNDILPVVVENLSTYATGSSREELSAARDHFGFMGASYGAYLTNNCILKYCYDIVSNFSLCGGGYMDYGIIQSAWAKNGCDELPMGCLYISTGAFDNHGDPHRAYLTMKNDTERFDEENLVFGMYTNTAHEQREWINAVYNTAQLFFR